MYLLLSLALAVNLATLALLYGVWRGLRADLDRLRAGRAEAPPGLPEATADVQTLRRALRAELQAERRLSPDPARMVKKAAMATGQQMEWRAHLCHMLDLPFGALPATRHFAASPDLLVHIASLILRHKPLVVVECGAGVSTLVAARALQQAGQGHLHTLEAEAEFASLTRTRLAALGLEGVAGVIHAPLADLPRRGDGQWYRLAEVAALPDPIDLLIIDGPQMTETASRAPALDQLFPRLAPGGRVIFDDSRRREEAAFLATIPTRFPHLARTDLPAEKGAALFESKR